MFQKFKLSCACFYSSFFELMLKAARLGGKGYTTQRSGRTLELVKHGQQLAKVIGGGGGRGIAQQIAHFLFKFLVEVGREFGAAQLD